MRSRDFDNIALAPGFIRTLGSTVASTGPTCCHANPKLPPSRGYGGPRRSLVRLRAKRFGETSTELEERSRGGGGTAPGRSPSRLRFGAPRLLQYGCGLRDASTLTSPFMLARRPQASRASGSRSRRPPHGLRGSSWVPLTSKRWMRERAPGVDRWWSVYQTVHLHRGGAGTRLASGDPRLSLEERYKTHDGYVSAVASAAESLVKQAFLLRADADAMIAQAKASGILK